MEKRGWLRDSSYFVPQGKPTKKRKTAKENQGGTSKVGFGAFGYVVATTLINDFKVKGRKRWLKFWANNLLHCALANKRRGSHLDGVQVDTHRPKWPVPREVSGWLGDPLKWGQVVNSRDHTMVWPVITHSSHTHSCLKKECRRGVDAVRLT